MGAAAERWAIDCWPGEPGAEEASLGGADLRSSRRLEAVDGGRALAAADGGATDTGAAAPESGSDARWNVLAAELVAYPTPAQRIWLEPQLTEGPHRRESGGATQRSAGSRSTARAYADAWLDAELEQLRVRRTAALTREHAQQPTAARALHRSATGDRSERAAPAPLLGDAATTIDPLPLRTPARRTIQPAPRRRARDGEAVATRSGTRVAHVERRGLRRLLPGAATLAVLVGSWFGIGSLAASAHAVQMHRLGGSVAVAGGFDYVVQPGDTLWSIASRAEPNGDPRPLVDRLQSELGSRPLQPGERLFLPSSGG